MHRHYSIAYPTCGFATGLTVVQIIERLSQLGYEGIEIELDRMRLHPYVHNKTAFDEVKAALKDTKLRAAVHTGGSFFLGDVRHHPTCVSPAPIDRRRWVGFVKASIIMSAELGAECVIVQSGYKFPTTAVEESWKWLLEGLAELDAFAVGQEQRLALEWNPEMLVRSADDYWRLHREIQPRMVGCVLDLGQLRSTEARPLRKELEPLAGHLYHAHLGGLGERVSQEDSFAPSHLDLHELFDAFDSIGYRGLCALQPEEPGPMDNDRDLAQESIRLLRPYLPDLLEA